MKLLLIEDEDRLAAALSLGLSEEGHRVDRAATGKAGRDLGLSGIHDVILLDWALPDLDGVSVLREWRRRGLRTPVLFLTARGSTGEKVLGLRSGADDYVVKPFDFDELLARLEALHRRSGAGSVTLGDVALDPLRCALVKGEAAESLTAREYGLLAALSGCPGEVLSRSSLLGQVWGEGFDGTANVVDVYVGYLRTKLGRLGALARIESVRGVGYRLSVREV
jgi:DNA-binding response OmpR family regulator